MKTLSHGFLFLVGLSWLLAEVCIDAGAGFWTPLWFYLGGFIIMFSVMGCLPLSEKVINLAGPVFTLLLGASIAFYGVDAYQVGLSQEGASFLSLIGGHLRLLGGGILILLAVSSLLQREDETASAH